MKHQRSAAAAEQQAVSLALSLSLGAVHADSNKKHLCAAPDQGGEFVCKTCSRSFPTFQALGGHRTSHLRGRHGLALALAGGDHYSFFKPKKTTSTDDQQKTAAVHQCHVCGLEFEMGQALGGHMRRHREESAALQAPPVLLALFI